MLLVTAAVSVPAEDGAKLQSDNYAILSKAQEDMEKFEYKSAKLKLDIMLKKEELPAYDKAVAYQTLGYVENALGDFAAAANAFQQALSLNILPDKVTHDLRYAIAKILIHLEQAKEGLNYLTQWFANEAEASAESHIVAASAYYQLKDYAQLILQIEKALSKSANPPLDWYNLLLAAYYEQKEFSKAATILEKILVSHPDKKDYWLQLAGLYQEGKNENKALAAFEMAYQYELLNEQEIVDLARMYLYMEIPLKSAKLLEKELAIGNVSENQKNLILLADSWLLSKENEKAKSLFREIVQSFNDNKTRLRLGRLYIESEQWQEAASILTADIKTDDKSLLANINLLLGIANYNLNKTNLAVNAFNRALNDKSTADQARWWLDYLKNISKQAS